MSFLVDTNIWSEPTKLRPDESVVAWLSANEGDLFVSAITIGELRRGVERLAAGRRKLQLHAWLEAFGRQMQDRTLDFTASTAHVWGQLTAKWEAAGFTLPLLDGQIAATAHHHGLIVATRNTADFIRTGVKLHNPFQAV